MGARLDMAQGVWTAAGLALVLPYLPTDPCANTTHRFNRGGRTLLVALLAALLGGEVLLNVFKEEIPTNRDSSFGWFGTGRVFYSLLLALATATSA